MFFSFCQRHLLRFAKWGRLIIWNLIYWAVFSNEIRFSFDDSVLWEFCRLWKLWHQVTFYPWNHFQLDKFWHYLRIVLQNGCLISKKTEIKISIFSKNHASWQKNNHFLKPKLRLQRWFWILTWFQKNCSKSKLPYYRDEKTETIAQFYHHRTMVFLILNSFFETTGIFSKFLWNHQRFQHFVLVFFGKSWNH